MDEKTLEFLATIPLTISLDGDTPPQVTLKVLSYGPEPVTVKELSCYVIPSENNSPTGRFTIAVGEDNPMDAARTLGKIAATYMRSMKMTQYIYSDLCFIDAPDNYVDVLEESVAQMFHNTVEEEFKGF